MINNKKTGLFIFDNFQIDFRLPKWKKKIEASKKEHGQVFYPQIGARSNRDNSLSVVSSNSVINGSWSNTISSGMVYSPQKEQKETKDSLWDKMFNRKKIKKRIEEMTGKMQLPNFTIEPTNTPEDDSKIEITVEDFFKSVANSAEEIKLIDGRLESFIKAVDYLQKTGQKAVEEHMMQELEICRAETQLFACGLVKVITEKQVVEFAGKSSRKIKLDWIQNFTRQIPSSIIDVKVKLDEKDIFDNYVVMHYDPDNKGTADTQAEKERKKDPILFGVLVGSFKLYYVGDWKDEYCDLTFDKLIETLGEGAITANNLTANVVVPNEQTENEK